MGKKGERGPEFKYVTVVEELKSDPRVKCNKCGQVMVAGSGRIRLHFIGGHGCGVARCTAEDISVVKAEMIEIEEKVKERRQKGKEKRALEAMAGHEEAELRRQKRRQPGIVESFKKASQDELHRAVSRCFYANGLSFNLIRNKHFRAMCEKLKEVGSVGTLPSFDALRNQLLDKAYKESEDTQKDMLEQNKKKGCGVTLVSDGWKNVQKRPLINTLAVTPSGPLFLGSLDTSGKTKTAEFVKEVLAEKVELLEESGNQVVLVLTDSASNCRLARELLQAEYPKIIVGACLSHCLDLFLEDVAKLSWCRDAVQSAKDVVKLFLHHERPLALLREKTEKSLLFPVETRFASHYLMMKRLFELKNQIKQVVVSDEFDEFLKTAKKQERNKTAVASVLDQDFWEVLEMYTNLMGDTISFLRLVDGDTPTVGKVWAGMNNIAEKILKFGAPAHVDPLEIHHLFMKRWEMGHNPLHSIGFVLDPEYVECDQASNAEVMNDFFLVLDGWYESEESGHIEQELAKYQSREGVFGRPSTVANSKTMLAYKWWSLYGVGVPKLRDLAIKVLSQVSSVGAAERNWKDHSWLHSKLRNRLTPSRANKLVHVHGSICVEDKIWEAGYEETMVEWAPDEVIDDE